MARLDDRHEAGNSVNTTADTSYRAWARSFAAHFTRLRADESLSIDEALDYWCNYYGKLGPQEAAELASGVWPNGHKMPGAAP
jgi:hypothetical protein